MSRMAELAARLDDAARVIEGPTEPEPMSQRCLVWLGGGPGDHITTFRKVSGPPSLTVLAANGRVPLLTIEDEHVAQELWAALRLTFPSLG